MAVVPAWDDPLFAESVEILADATEGATGTAAAEARRIAFALRARPGPKTFAQIESAFDRLPLALRRDISRQATMTATLRATDLEAEQIARNLDSWRMSPIRRP